MARITITVYTTLHGKVEVEQVFDETCVVGLALCDTEGTVNTTCVAKAVLSAGEAIAAAHGETLAVAR